MTAPPTMNLGFMAAGSLERVPCPGLGPWVAGSRRGVPPIRPIVTQARELALLQDQAAPVAEEHDGGEPVGGGHEAPVVRHQASASASAASTRARRATK